MILIGGLGNPGDEYKRNRHNLGFQFIDYIAKKMGNTKFITKKKSVDFVTIKYQGKDVTLVKPLKFMNNSGESILFMAAFLRVKEDNILIAYDDMDLEFGEIRLRNSDFETSHNGIKSVRAFLKKENFTRMRIGIGRPKDKEGNLIYDSEIIREYVLSDFSLKEEFLLNEIVFKYGFQIVEAFIKGGFEEALKKLSVVMPLIRDELSREPTLPNVD